MIPLNLRIVPGIYGIVRLGPEAPVPDWFNGPGLAAAIRASDELTLLCQQDRIPDGVKPDLNWRCFRSVGPFAFNATGIVLSLIQPLSRQGIGIFVVCTFDGEHILVADKEWNRSRLLLEEAGHNFVE